MIEYRMEAPKLMEYIPGKTAYNGEYSHIKTEDGKETREVFDNLTGDLKRTEEV